MRNGKADATVAEDLRAAYDAATLDIGAELEEALAPEEPEDPPTDEPPAADPAAPGDSPAVDPEPRQVPPGGAAAPEHWSREDRAFFEGLPDDGARARVLDWRKSIENGARERFEEAADARREVAELDRLFQPLMPQLQAQGLSRQEALRSLVAAEQRLRQDPIGGIAALVDAYARQAAGTGQARDLIRHLSQALKVDPIAPTNPQGDGGQAQDQDPMARRIAALESEITRDREARQTSERQQREQTIRTAQTSIDGFAAEKDGQGQPAHPHFEAVRPLMGALMQAASAAGRPLALKEAYVQAVWAQPELRDGLIKAQAEATAEAAAEQRRASLARSRAAATPRTPSTPANRAEEDLPLREELRRQLEAQTTRARI